MTSDGTTGADAAPVRVLVDAVSAHTGGGLTYAFEQLRALAARDDVRLTVLATQPLARWLADDGAPLAIRVQPRRPLALRLAWEQAAVPALARGHDVVYMIGNFAALGLRGPQVVTLQNPNHFGAAARAVRAAYPSRPIRARLVLEAALARASVRRATRALVVSEAMRATMEEDVGPLPGLRVIHSGAPTLPPGLAARAERRYALSVANDYPHKDWDGLLAAFAAAPDLPPLVVAGAFRTPRRRRQLEAAIARGAPGRVTLVGAVDDRAAMAGLYGGALCLVAHSRLEAFSLTPCEALALGVPVAATDIPPHREVCGARAAYYDIDDPRSLARAVREAVGAGTAGGVDGLTTWRENAAATAALLREAAGAARR